MDQDNIGDLLTAIEDLDADLWLRACSEVRLDLYSILGNEDFEDDFTWIKGDIYLVADVTDDVITIEGITDGSAKHMIRNEKTIDLCFDIEPV